MSLNPEKKLPGGWEVTEARSLDRIETLRPVWDRIQSTEPHPVPNADINRYVSIIKARVDDVRPYVLLVTRNGCPAAMIIGRIEWQKLRIRLGYKKLFSPTMKCLSIVYGGILGQPSRDCCEVIVGELANVLRRHEADVVFLNHLRVDSPMHSVCKASSGLWSSNHSTLTELHWRTDLPDSVEQFYGRVPSSRKRRWSRNVKQLERLSSLNIRVDCYRSVDDIDQLVNLACRIEESTYKKGLAAGFTDSAVNRALLEQAARDGWLRAYVLYIGDEACAFQFDTQYRETQFTEHGSFDPKWSRGSPGTVLLTKVLEQLCEESCVRAVDYGFGHASYKEKFGTESWPEESVYIFSPRLRPMLVKTAMSATQAFAVMLNRATTYFNLDSWVKRTWRRMLSKKHS